jgi:hypothetical protein
VRAFDVTGRSFSICNPYGVKQSETTAWLVSHSRQAVKNDRKKKNYWNVVLTLESIPYKVPQKSVKGSGCGVEWVKFASS